MLYNTRSLRTSLYTFSALALGACTSLQKNNVSVQYYQISGNSTAALDRQIKQKGPRIAGGRHAVAVARIKMVPNLVYTASGNHCEVTQAKVTVDAKVTLPQWTGRATADKQLIKAWENIDRYTRLHESVHVQIAFRFAKEMESSLLKLRTKGSCADLRKQAGLIVNQYLDDHDKIQKQFDADEQKRFAKYAEMLRKNSS